MPKYSKFRKGKGHVVEQEVLKGNFKNSVFVWRCQRKNYNPCPTVLNIPFTEEAGARDYGLRCFNEGLRCSMRKAQRTQGNWEVQIYFPMGFTIKNVTEALESYPFLAVPYDSIKPPF